MSEVAFIRMGKLAWYKHGTQSTSLFKCRDSVSVENSSPGTWANAYGSDGKQISISGVFQNAVAILYAQDAGGNDTDTPTATILSSFDEGVRSDASNAFRLHNDGDKVTLQYLQNSITHYINLSIAIFVK